MQRERAASLGLSARVNATLEAAVEKLGLSARALVKVLRVARVVADLEAETRVRAVAEAIQGGSWIERFLPEAVACLDATAPTHGRRGQAIYQSVGHGEVC